MMEGLKWLRMESQIPQAVRCRYHLNSFIGSMQLATLSPIIPPHLGAMGFGSFFGSWINVISSLPVA